ncbi:hypothetical protein [Candidatus Mycoplasma haematominutum]|uniref:Secreted protein n=1 Tax=Candidatus Mycoplasma haematominutum 'Birmingham 1' TaxID=1116213 RepID=G8C3R1_9MOLU|nr:hypothetical protein [Candidatus Mycoplasma haematominutum]CCE66959.1 hypothetical protein MHM_04410 [Candidatus Mycoplasma haematominutum 'Birmingham 1']
MIPVFKGCLGLCALAGISSAVAVPVTMSTQKGYSTSDYDSGSTSEVQLVSDSTSTVAASQNPITVVECNTSTSGVRSAISFGAVNVKEVCWEGSSTSGEKDNLQEFLGKAWLSATSWAKLNENKWATYCYTRDSESDDSATENRTLWKGNRDECNGVEYVALSQTENSAFVKKELKSGSNNTLFFCESNCWQGNTFNLTTAQSQNVTENTGSWAELKFWNSSSAVTLQS